MNCIKYDINISANRPACVIPISDVHIGHVHHDKDLFKKTIEWIKKKKAYAVLIGDQIDGISQHDRRYENPSIAAEFKDYLDNLHHKQTESFIEKVLPIKKQLIGVMAGNHEITVKKQFSYDATEVIAKALCLPIITDPSFIVLNFKEKGKLIQNYTILASHGCWMGGRKRGSKINSMEDKVSDFEFDAIIAGHTHDSFVSDRERVVCGRNGIVRNQKKFFINTGSFVSSYNNDEVDTWASRSVFSPKKTGVVRMDFYLKRREKGSRYIDCHVRI